VQDDCYFLPAFASDRAENATTRQLYLHLVDASLNYDIVTLEWGNGYAVWSTVSRRTASFLHSLGRGRFGANGKYPNEALPATMNRSAKAWRRR